jgi:hypothetical protein
MKMMFSANNRINDDKMARIIEAGVDLTKYSLNSENNFLVKKYSGMKFENTPQNNAEYMRELLDYCSLYSPVCGMPNVKKTDGKIDWNEKSNVATAMMDQNFRQMYFAIVAKVIQLVNAKTEVEDILLGANVSYISLGDSETFEMDSQQLYKIQNGAHGNLYSVYQEQLRSGTTLVPEPKIASISFNVAQMTPIGYDFGKQVAKLAKSFRVAMYVDVVNKLFQVANVSSTVFYKANFAKPTFLELVDRIEAVNGGVKAGVYGTKQGLASMSDNITTGFRGQDEKVETGLIMNPYGVPMYQFSQAVDTSNANATFIVPNNRLVIMSAIGDKPVKLVKEDYMFATSESGLESTLWNQVYTLNDSWIVGYIMSGVYGIQMI